MADRTLSVKIIGDERDLIRAFGRSTRATRQFEAQMSGVSRSVRNVFAAAGVALGATAIVQAFRSTISAAIDFESSFAGVRKTVDATEPQLKALARGFRELSKDIPVSVDELNRIGEAAGQLGIQRTAILDFTETIAAIGVSTNLASDQAADAFARLANITQIPQDQFDNLGSTVVDLGNKLAATESEITDFGLRIAAAGKIVGLTVDETLAIAGAFTSVGVEAEAGGTAVSKVFISLANAAKSGGKQLELFAKTAGTSASEFRRQFETDTSGAFVAFVEGLKRVDAEGGNVFKTLKDLGLTDVRLIRAFLSISQSGDLLTRSLAIGSRAWEQNSALQIEAAKRYETTASKLQIFQNRVNDLQITLGNVLAPALLEIITPLGKWLESTENQERVQRALIQTMEDARSVFEGVRAVVQPLAEGVKSLADRMGGLKNAVELLLVAMVAAKVVSFGTALTGLGTNALVATGKVSALRLALLRLGAIGVIVVGVEVILNKDKIDQAIRGPGGLLDDLKLGFLKGGGQLELPAGINAAQLNKVRNELAAIKGDGDIVVKALDAAIQKLIEAGRRGDSKLIGAARRSREAAKVRLESVRPGPQGRGQRQEAESQRAAAELEVTARKTQLNFKKLLNSLDLDLERALGTSSLSDDVSAFRKIEAAIKARIAAVGNTFKLSKQLIETQNQIAQALTAQAEQVKQKSQDAFDALLGSLNLNLARAGASKSFQDDLRALEDIENAIKARIKVEGRTTDLLSQLFQVQQDQAGIARQIRERAAERKQGLQFEALGLTAEGDKKVPGVGALRGRQANLEEQVKGTFLDTGKTRSQFERIAKVLAEGPRKVGKDVRSAILQMFNDISSALDEGAGKGPLTKFQKTGAGKLLEGLGLSPEEIKALRQRLSQVGPGGTIPTAGIGAFGFSFQPGTQPSFGVGAGAGAGAEMHIYIDGEEVEARVTRRQQKKDGRTAKQRRGVRAGR